MTILNARPGLAVLHISGRGLGHLKDEAGGHRWQRVPPNDKRGRVHTSTITVAVLSVPTEVEIEIDPRDLRVKVCRGSGAGGQHRNVTDSAVQLTHTPTGIIVRSESERSQLVNKRAAMAELRARLQRRREEDATSSRNTTRKRQVGSGQRGDKRRTIRVRDDRVTDHKTGKAMPYKDYARGHIDRLWA